METRDKKLEYVQPAMEVVALDEGAVLLAGSNGGDTESTMDVTLEEEDW